MVLVELWRRLPASMQRGLVQLDRAFDKVKQSVYNFDRRTGIITVAIPFSLVMLTTVGTGTIVIDRQFELRSLRRQSVSHREHEQEEQRKQFLKFLSQTSPTDQLDNSVPVPRDSQI
ncbi:putative transmembrane protein [Toxoplasma gondii RUB]|uniref:Transmembrane protein n=9 Tax=Toxoplasma gondii TaxID=5811 RepID=S7US91_TOXGG|nr:hypothetical protein TGGT1_240780 [Toxoplasma gondii GT1]KAF4643373.1 hypothetical protein TGRH88_030390 [Toxoplasma gondii]KFG38710.1 putative transmembrane protein [Toxoplasma gondii p89]KFG39309.1 putative transmembrane protein [Toxoplasma gondii GAB2-2007-GAL-DOM2]KFG48782.1 putative transmembrane protein [Toxoplasma gondii FOU]KFG59797.1 putative transmembrane protein [Toxoplasma gondii RUB]KFH14869.1 putative transmembrane protein [Toxoplasma gondii MAS]PIM02561.1 putative transmemb